MTLISDYFSLWLNENKLLWFLQLVFHSSHQYSCPVLTSLAVSCRYHKCLRGWIRHLHVAIICCRCGWLLCGLPFRCCPDLLLFMSNYAPQWWRTYLMSTSLHSTNQIILLRQAHDAKCWNHRALQCTSCSWLLCALLSECCLNSSS